jgi:hypothetical protein
VDVFVFNGMKRLVILWYMLLWCCYMARCYTTPAANISLGINVYVLFLFSFFGCLIINFLNNLYRVIHKSFRDVRPLRYGSRDGHVEGHHFDRGRDSASF